MRAGDRRQRLAELRSVSRRGSRRDRGASRSPEPGEPVKPSPDRPMLVPGPKSRAFHAEERRFIAPGVQRIAQLSELTLASGSGCRLIDVDGNEYLDFFAG